MRWMLALALLASAGGIARGQTPPPDTASGAAHQDVVDVLVRDARTGLGISGAAVSAAGAATVFADSTGRLRLRLAGSTGPVRITRLGYRPYEGPLTVAPGATAVVSMEPVPFELAPVRVSSRALGAGEAIQSVAVMDAAEIAERMAASIAAVIAAQPGVHARTNGPLATQPVIRGLSGDRVLVLEDGLRTGDLATSAPDHAVTVEPAAARHIEVIRGPAGLLYGSNTLGGVVNVMREDVPRDRPQTMDWALSGYSESVNRGLGGAGRARAGVGPIVLQVDGSARTAGDTRTPGGIPLPFTDLDGFDVGIGAALVDHSGHAGVAAREYRTHYGVPSSYDGATLPGSHEGGVYVDVRRTSGRFDLEWRPDAGPVEVVSAGGNAVRYEHSEFERGGFVGTRFGQLASTGESVVRLSAGKHRTALGAATQWRDLRAAGSYTGTRPAVQRTTAAFVVNEMQVGSAVALAGLRVDRITFRPLDSTETLLLRDIRSREFSALTGALGARVRLGGGWTLGAQVARAFRPPSIEELYSAGPHLASYAYEIGSPNLGAERGLGADAVLRWDGTRAKLELTGYAMRVNGFIAYAPQIDSSTGLPMRDPRLRRYVVYRPHQFDAELAGLEGRLLLLPASGWSLDLVGDAPIGRRTDGEALPSMPPASARLELRRIALRWGAAVNVERRFAQRAVPTPPPAADATCDVVLHDGEARALPAEYCPSAAAVLLGASATWRVPERAGMRWNTSIVVSADNLLDARWRDPLWRAGLVAPQPGRNIRVAVRLEP